MSASDPVRNARPVTIVGTGSYLPERVLTNHDLEKMVETSDEWIRTRTGISERHIARDDEASSDMATEAARRAMRNAGVTPEEADLIVVATITPDMFFPNTACFVQDRLGARNAYCMDLSAACSGFLYGMDAARALIAEGSVRTALVIGAEKLSCITDWRDRATCVLFGDGAGAVVMRRADAGRGIMASHMGSDGALAELLNLPGGGSRNPASPATLDRRLHYMKMTGNEVFKHAVRYMCDAGQKALQRCGMTIDDVDWVIPHQANMRIISAIASRLGDCMDKFIVNLDRVGNLSAASVPVCLDEAARGGKLKKGDIVLFVAFGGGFTWGATVMEW
ncbi:MAG: ketoacyl-ACP synthase III [Lentisphaerae bacterium]|nr:ketoacyl-ACP synthase III [Lentisphaerota bacterium]